MLENVKENDQEFHSKDLPVVVAIILSGNPAVMTYRNGKEIFFVFNNKSMCEKIAQDFYEHRLNLDVFQFSKLMKQIRNFIKDQMQPNIAKISSNGNV